MISHLGIKQLKEFADKQTKAATAAAGGNAASAANATPGPSKVY